MTLFISFLKLTICCFIPYFYINKRKKFPILQEFQRAASGAPGSRQRSVLQILCPNCAAHVGLISGNRRIIRDTVDVITRSEVGVLYA